MDLTNFFSDNSIIFNCKSKSKKNVLEIISKIMSDVTSTKEDIIFEKEAIEYIIETHTEKEEGVRNLKRCLETIISKVNIYIPPIQKN